MARKKSPPSASPYRSPRRRAASLKNLEKAWQASRARWELTPARRAASLRSLQKAQQAIRARPRKLSPAQLAAVRRNLARARAALESRGRSPEHLAKLRRSIAGARAARTPEGALRHAEKVLKHGLFARRLRGPVAALGENPRDAQRLERLVASYLDPQNAQEEKLAGVIAAALWRHHRLYFAQAAWELERLRSFLAEAPRSRENSAEFTRLRVYALLEILLDPDQSADHSWRLLGATERLLRRFLRLRAGSDSTFRMGPRLITPRPNDRTDRELQELITDPDVRTDLLEFNLGLS
jgi:hypothetical protein